jgi:hypothetical protein
VRRGNRGRPAAVLSSQWAGLFPERALVDGQRSPL